MIVDSASNKFRAKIGIVLITPDLSFIEHAFQLEFPASNIVVKTLIARMLMIIELRVKNLKVFSDSNLVIGQLTEKFQVKNERILKYKVLVERNCPKGTILKDNQAQQ